VTNAKKKDSSWKDPMQDAMDACRRHLEGLIGRELERAPWTVGPIRGRLTLEFQFHHRGGGPLNHRDEHRTVFVDRGARNEAVYDADGACWVPVSSGAIGDDGDVRIVYRRLPTPYELGAQRGLETRRRYPDAGDWEWFDGVSLGRYGRAQRDGRGWFLPTNALEAATAFVRGMNDTGDPRIADPVALGRQRGRATRRRYPDASDWAWFDQRSEGLFAQDEGGAFGIRRPGPPRTDLAAATTFIRGMTETGDTECWCGEGRPCSVPHEA
jgi:hypothetical protein